MVVCFLTASYHFPTLFEQRGLSQFLPLGFRPLLFDSLLTSFWFDCPLFVDVKRQTA